jgi:hypothetical protein
MLTIAYYFLQVILCSGMLMGYYWLVLRNKRFHQYNRFYLLAAALLSWIVPLIKISWNRPLLHSETPPVMNILSVVADNNTQIEATLAQKVFVWNWDLIASCIYLAVAAVLLFGMLRAFVKLYRLMKDHSCKNVGDVFLILTHAQGTPFSFFRYIFWNEEIDIRSEAGQQILQHELTHVQQKHSFDKLFIQVMLIGGWFNPFFWLLRNEMEMIHEFIADKKAVNNGDTAALAQMLLTAAYPQQKFALTHPFFFSPIKRRLLMLTNNKNPRFSYIRRLVVLPLLAVVVVLFAFRSKEQRNNGELSVAAVVANYKEAIKEVFKKEDDKTEFLWINGKKIAAETVSIEDLKHAPYVLGLVEKEIGTGITAISLKAVANTVIPDPLFVVNGQRYAKTQLDNLDPSMIESVQAYKGTQAVELFGPDAINGAVTISLKPSYPKVAGTETGKEDDDFSFPTVTAQAKDTYNNIARNRNVSVKEVIYQGEQKVKVFEEMNEAITDNNGNFSVKIGSGTMGSGSKELAHVDMARGPFFVNIKVAVPPSVPAPWWVASDYYVDLGLSQLTVKDNRPDQVVAMPGADVGTAGTGFLRIMPNGDVRWTFQDVTISATSISINAGKDALDPTGKKAVETAADPKEENVLKEITVVGIGTKNAKTGNREQGTAPARFPGGNAAWEKYVVRNLNKDVIKNNNGPSGKYTVVVSFLVDKDGSISDVRADNDPGFGTKAEAERIIKKGPDWMPATDEKGQNVAYRQKQPVTFIYSEGVTARDAKLTPSDEITIQATGVANGTSTTSITTLPSFPGGSVAWAKYLDRNLNNDLPATKGGPPGKYIVRVSFMVKADGSLVDVSAENNPGYGTAEEAIRLISKGPKWVPALLNGKPVAYRNKVAISFVVKESNAANTDPSKKEVNGAPLNFNVAFNVAKGKDITISPNTTGTAVIDAPNVKKGDPILVTPQVDSPDWSVYSAWVSNDNKISVRFSNYTNKDVKISADDYKVVVIK